MATDKMFTVFGVSKYNGEYKVRFANDIMRIKVLAKHGHEDIRLADVEGWTTKVDGILKIKGMDEFQDAAAQSAIAEYLEVHGTTTTAKAPVQSKPAAKGVMKSKAKAVTPAKVTEDEDAPF
jgi:hypothetical protein